MSLFKDYKARPIDFEPLRNKTPNIVFLRRKATMAVMKPGMEFHMGEGKFVSIKSMEDEMSNAVDLNTYKTVCIPPDTVVVPVKNESFKAMSLITNGSFFIWEDYLYQKVQGPNVFNFKSRMMECVELQIEVLEVEVQVIVP